MKFVSFFGYCRIPEEWLNLGFIEGEQYPCPGLAFIPKQDGKSTKPSTDLIQMLNNLYEVNMKNIYI